MLKNIFGLSPRILILELFLENPESYMNVRQISKKINKNPGTVSKVIPDLITANLIQKIQIGEKSRAYRLNTENESVKLTLKYFEQIKKLYNGSSFN